MADTKAESTCCIRGVQYHIKLTTTPEAHTPFFTVEVSTKLFPWRWRGVFDEETLTRLTSQAGAIKSFASFSAMLRAALLCLSKSVSIDILSPDAFSNLTNNIACQTRAHRSRKKDDLYEACNRRIYLILTHRSEFEKCNYPLPLDLKSNQRSPSRSRKKPTDVLPYLAKNGFDDRNVALFELQVEVKKLREENNKLRECQDLESQTIKESHSKIRQEKEFLKRQLELQLAQERTQFQQELQASKRQQATLIKNLNLAKREVDSLKVQVRRLQAENNVYRRVSRFTKPNTTYQMPAKKIPPALQRTPAWPCRDRAISPSSHTSPAYRSSSRYSGGKDSRASCRVYPTTNRNGNGCLPPESRSRSYSPNYLPTQFDRSGKSTKSSVVRTLWPSCSDTAISAERGRPFRRKPNGNSCSPSRYSRNQKVLTEPVQKPYCNSSSAISAVSNRSHPMHNYRLGIFSGQSNVRSVSPSCYHVGKKKVDNCVNERERNPCVLGGGLRMPSEELLTKSHALYRKYSKPVVRDREYRCVSNESLESIKSVPKNIRGSPTCAETSSYTGAKFRELLGRLQGLTDKFPDSNSLC